MVYVPDSFTFTLPSITTSSSSPQALIAEAPASVYVSPIHKVTEDGPFIVIVGAVFLFLHETATIDIKRVSRAAFSVHLSVFMFNFLIFTKIRKRIRYLIKILSIYLLLKNNRQQNSWRLFCFYSRNICVRWWRVSVFMGKLKTQMTIPRL